MISARAFSSFVPGAGGSFVSSIERHEHAMDLAAGPHALHDLLAEIAALAEMQGLRLVGFLSQKPLADVFAVTRPAMFQADHAGSLGIGGFGAGGFQPRDQRDLFRRRARR